MNNYDRERIDTGGEVVGLNERFPLFLAGDTFVTSRSIKLGLETLDLPLDFTVQAQGGLRREDRYLLSPYDERDTSRITSDDFDLEKRIVREAMKASSHYITDNFPKTLRVDGQRDSFDQNGLFKGFGEMRIGKVGMGLPKLPPKDQAVQRIEFVVFVPEKGFSYVSQGNINPDQGVLKFGLFVPSDMAGVELPVIPAAPLSYVPRQLPQSFELRFPDSPDVLSTLEGMFIQRKPAVKFPKGVRQGR